MQQGNFINVFLARYISGAYAHYQGHYILSCSIWFSAPSLWMSGGPESRCVGRVYGADCARHHWGDLGVDGWIILGWISRRWDVGIRTGLGWPRIGTGYGQL